MSASFTLPRRTGEPPHTGPAIPHQQLTQTAPANLQEQLWQHMINLEHTVQGPSHVSMPDTRALHLEPDYVRGPRQSIMAGTEFAHLHGPRDGSLHMTLPPQIAAEIVAKGWGEIHPIVRNSPNPTLVMVFGPRDQDELATVWQIVRQSYLYATGGNPKN